MARPAMSLKAKCRRAKLNYATVYSRIRAGWTEYRALSAPAMKRKRAAQKRTKPKAAKKARRR